MGKHPLLFLPNSTDAVNRLNRCAPPDLHGRPRSTALEESGSVGSLVILSLVPEMGSSYLQVKVYPLYEARSAGAEKVLGGVHFFSHVSRDGPEVRRYIWLGPCARIDVKAWYQTEASITYTFPK